MKCDLLRDAALERRSEEALVRIVVPVTEAEAAAVAVSIASDRVPEFARSPAPVV